MISSVCIDTEFSSLSDPRLISIGAVTDDGRHFYGVTDDVPGLICTPFVREKVLLALDVHAADVRGSHDTVARAFSAWLASLGGEPALLVDDECDLELVRRLLRVGLGRTADMPSCRLMPLSSDPAMATAFDGWFAADPARVRHNALEDALAFHHALRAAGRLPPAT